jgi:sec-independent protein translocase protein TatC
VSDSQQPSDTPDAAAEVVPTWREKAMGFWQHLEELRWTLIKCAVAFTICAVFIGYNLDKFNDALSWPLNTAKAKYPALIVELGTTTIMEGFNVVIQMCVLGGLVMASPFILFFIGQFVAPALNEREAKAVIPILSAAAALFLLGTAFSFFKLVPNTIGIALEINQSFGYVPRWTPGSYYSLLTWLVLGVGASFEFPLVIVLLVWLGIMSTAFLRKYRRHAIVLIFVMAAIVTPTPDPITQTMFAVPLYLLYEIAIIAGARVEKSRAAQLNAKFDV